MRQFLLLLLLFAFAAPASAATATALIGARIVRPAAVTQSLTAETAPGDDVELMSADGSEVLVVVVRRAGGPRVVGGSASVRVIERQPGAAEQPSVIVHHR